MDKVLAISKKLGLTHIGSNLSVFPILQEIYKIKKPQDKVIMDNAHAHLSHLMFTNPKKAEQLITKYGIHCDRRAGCDASGGSLGHGIGISIGMSLANPKATIYCIVSDGSLHEGSNWEALRIRQDLKIKNIETYYNFNGYSAVAKLDLDELTTKLSFFEDNENIIYTNNGEGFNGVQGHYKKI